METLSEVDSRCYLKRADFGLVEKVRPLDELSCCHLIGFSALDFAKICESKLPKFSQKKGYRLSTYCRHSLNSIHCLNFCNLCRIDFLIMEPICPFSGQWVQCHFYLVTSNVLQTCALLFQDSANLYYPLDEDSPCRASLVTYVGN